MCMEVSVSFLNLLGCRRRDLDSSATRISELGASYHSVVLSMQQIVNAEKTQALYHLLLRFFSPVHTYVIRCFFQKVPRMTSCVISGEL